MIDLGVEFWKPEAQRLEKLLVEAEESAVNALKDRDIYRLQQTPKGYTIEQFGISEQARISLNKHNLLLCEVTKNAEKRVANVEAMNKLLKAQIALLERQAKL